MSGVVATPVAGTSGRLSAGRPGSVPRTPPGGYGRPPTGGRLSTRTASSDRLTPMPDYMAPVTKSASNRWRKLHEDHMMGKLMDKRSAKKERNKITREEARKLAKKIPMEALSKAWMNDNEITVESRAWMVDKVLPTMILGVEKLLQEVDKKELADTDDPDSNFNPINFLAQYLMRNNPKYSNFSEASPYIRGLREVTEELKSQLYEDEDNRLAKIKADARRKREERETQEMMKKLEKQRREEALQNQYKEWNAGVYPDGRVELALVQNALRAFAEIAEHYPDDIRDAAAFAKDLDPTDDSGRTIPQKEFVLYVNSYVCDMPSDVFDTFISHMDRCASAYRTSAERDQRKSVLTHLFVSCDHTGVGLLDRHRILNLFEMFYDRAQTPVREDLRNPRKWPVVEVDEVMSDSEDEGDHPKFIDNNKDVTAEAGGKKPDEPVPVVVESPPEETPAVEKSQEEEKPSEESKPEETGESLIEIKEEKSESPEQQEESPKEAADQEQKDVDESKEDTPQEEKADLGVDDASLQPYSATTSKGKEENSAAETEQKKSEEPKEASPTQVAAPEADNDKPGKNDTEGDPEPSEGGNEQKSSADDECLMTINEELAGDSPRDTSSRPPKSGVTFPDDDGEPELAELSDKGDQSVPKTGIERPPMTQQSRVSFAEGTTFERERTLLTSQGTRSQSQASAFDENTLNMSQFVQLTETFLGDEPNMDAFNHVVRYIREGYVETEDERMNRLMKARMEAQEAKRKALLNSLFEMWDNDGSGYLELEEVEAVMKRYKDGMESECINKAKKEYKKKTKFADNRLSKREFRDLVFKVVSFMPGGDSFDYFVEFLLNSVERSYTERVRGEARKKWLQQIINAAETSAANMEPVYKCIFQSLYKDAEAHGQGKAIAAYIAMLERNTVQPNRGDFLLRYTSATTDDAPLLLNKALFKDMKGISFAAVETGKPIHVPRVKNHGNIHFWNTERKEEEMDGSFIVVPLKDRKKRVFGLLGLDTLRDPHSRAIFITHEIQFFQGVAKAFSIAYHHVDVRQKTLRISESAVAWIHRRCPHVTEITAYMVEPDNKSQDYVLRKMMVTDHKGNPNMQKNPLRLERKDNLFRDYLFKCVDNSESVAADAYGDRHLAFPLRDDEGRAIVVIDVSIGELRALPKGENKEVMKMLKLLQMAYKEISRESREGEKTMMLESEKNDDDSRTDILFDRLMLMELRENVAKLDAKAYAELKSYKEPPQIVHQILKSVLAIFYPDKAREGELDDWGKCKTYVDPKLSNTILAFDPTGSDNSNVPVELINTYLDEVPHGTVSKHGSIPAQYLYNWVFVCVSLIEHSRKMKENASQNALDANDGVADDQASIGKGASPTKVTAPPPVQKENTEE